jgi:hypothetical protein
MPFLGITRLARKGLIRIEGPRAIWPESPMDDCSKRDFPTDLPHKEAEKELAFVKPLVGGVGPTILVVLNDV